MEENKKLSSLQEFYKRNPEKLKNKIVCEICNHTYRYPSKTLHMKSNKHELGALKKKLAELENK